MKKKLKQKFIIIIFGPTAVGKSAFAEKLAQELQQAQLINCDLGQFYTKLSIGTAKPEWKSGKIKQHLFDIIDEPKDFNVRQYRELLFDKIDEIWAENDIPILVGGSGFYLKSLFFPPLKGIDLTDENEFAKNILDDFGDMQDKDLWEALKKVDPDRAKDIDKNDIYRIKRALDLWIKTGRKPSEFAPVFNFPSNFLFIFLNKDRKVLYEKINARTDAMIKEGWIDEVRELINCDAEICSKIDIEWKSFLKKKKLIGYDLIIDYLSCPEDGKFNFFCDQDKEILLESIKKKTRNYAKRQITFWKFLEKQLKKEVEKNKYTNKVETRIEEFKLVASDSDLNKPEDKGLNETFEINLYIKKLLAYLEPLF